MIKNRCSSLYDGLGALERFIVLDGSPEESSLLLLGDNGGGAHGEWPLARLSVDKKTGDRGSVCLPVRHGLPESCASIPEFEAVGAAGSRPAPGDAVTKRRINMRPSFGSEAAGIEVMANGRGVCGPFLPTAGVQFGSHGMVGGAEEVCWALVERGESELRTAPQNGRIFMCGIVAPNERLPSRMKRTP